MPQMPQMPSRRSWTPESSFERLSLLPGAAEQVTGYATLFSSGLCCS